MKNNKKNLAIAAIVIIGIILIGIVSFVIIKSNQTIKVWVPAESMATGDIITEDKLKQINVPVDTPGNYLNNKETILGYKLKNSVEENQLLYESNFLLSWETYNDSDEIPEDYIVTSIQVDDSKAVGGLIVAGDTVDVLGVSSSGKKIGFDEANVSEINGRENIGTNVYYILSNVKVINTNSSLSKAQENDLSEVVDGKGEDGAYYIVALSYDDAKKLRQAEGMLDIWLNISPRQNNDSDPLIAQMIGQSFSGLHDAQNPVQDKDGNIIDGIPMVQDKDSNNKKIVNPEKEKEDEDKE